MPRKKGPENGPRNSSPSEEEALRRLDLKGMRALEPYPGKATLSWRFACKTCGAEKCRPLLKWQTFGCKGCTKRLPIQEVERVLATGSLRLNGDFTTATAVPVICSVCGESFSANVSAFKSRGAAPCKYCSGARLSTRDILDRLSLSNFECVGELPRRATQPFHARCQDCGHISKKTINSISVGKGCIRCAPNRPVDESEALALFRSRNLKPLGPFPGANKGWLSLCLICGEEPAPHFTSLAMFPERKCEYCSGKAVNPSRAERVMREAKLAPLEPYPGSLLPWRCECLTCGNRPSPSYSSVKDGKRCIYCFPGGVDYKLPGLLYLISHEDFEAGKVGIQTYSSKRLQKHIKNGWSISQLWLGPTGRAVHSIEQEVKSKLRLEFGAESTLATGDMPAGGHTETFLLSEVSLRSVNSAVKASAAKQNVTLFQLGKDEYLSTTFCEWVETTFEAHLSELDSTP